ncbi:MAG: fibronectin type III domain-containing protein, partial [Elusimicrobiota bacterium]
MQNKTVFTQISNGIGYAILKISNQLAGAAILGAMFSAGFFVFPASAQIESGFNIIQPFAFSQAGSTATSASYETNGSLGETSASSFTTSGYILYSGLMSILSAPGPATNLASAAQSSAAVSLSWSAPGYDGELGTLQTGSTYYIEYSTSSSVTWSFPGAQIAISTSGPNPGDSQAYAAAGLWANTTYFFSLWTADSQGDLSALSNQTTAATLAQAPITAANAFLMVGISSATAAWMALPPNPSSSTSEGYELDASSVSDFSGTILSSMTSNPAVDALTVSGLFSNTTYYFRVGSRNPIGLNDFTVLGSTLTQISVDLTSPTAVANLSASTGPAGTAFLSWSAPSEPNDNPLSGTYKIQYSTWSGISWSTTAAQVNITTSGVVPGSAQSYQVSGLDANSTYYFYLWTANQTPVWSALSNGATIATLAPIVSNIEFLSISTSGATLSWTALPPYPSSTTSEGYELDASSTNFGAVSPGGAILSSATMNSSNGLLTVSGLFPNTTYYFRAGSLNWAGAVDYAAVLSTPTLAEQISPAFPTFAAVYETSASVQWTALPPYPSSATSEGYELDASSTNFGAVSPGGAILSSATVNSSNGLLTVSGLQSDTTYYFRAASLNWADVGDYASMGSTATLTSAPATVAISEIGLSTASLSWTDPIGGAQGYELEASSTDFGAVSPGGAIVSSSTANNALSALSVSGLSPNTTYYFQVGSLN